MTRPANGSEPSAGGDATALTHSSKEQSDEYLKPVMAVWRVYWLPGSETFVRNQLNAFRRWNAVPVGAMKIASPLATSEDVLLFEEGLRGRVQQRLFRISRRSRHLERILRANNVSLIHAHFGFDATLVAPTARRLRIPLAVTVHGYDVTSEPRRRGISGMVYRSRLRHTFRTAAVVLPVSDFIARKAHSWGAPLEKITVHYIGIPLDEPIKYGNRSADVVFVGRLVEKKGVPDLLKALGGVPMNLRPEVVIVGDGPLREECEDLARSLGVKARFVGWQSSEEVRGFLWGAKVFAAPSKTADSGDQEGLGMIFLEAGNAGLPVVAYRHGGVGEAVIDGVTGFLAPEGDIATLRDNIMKLVSDPDLARRMGQAGRSNVSTHFDILRQTQRLESLFTGIVNGHLE
jgi:colanic acid/amylovoran biosynthesis glycosyltransferase